MPLHKFRRAASGISKGIVSFTHRRSYNSGASTTYSLSNTSIGDAPTGGNRRFVVVVACSVDAGAIGGEFFATGDMTIGGSNADYLFIQSGITTNSSGVMIGYSEIATGTTTNIVLDSATSDLGMVADVWTIVTGYTGLAVRGTYGTTDTSDPTFSLDVLVNTPVVAGVAYTNGGPFTWDDGTSTYGTEHQDVDLFSTEYCSTWSWLSDEDNATKTLRANESNVGESAATAAIVFEGA